MVKNLPAWLFMAIALVVIAAALIPVLRFAIGVDAGINMPFTTVVVLLIGGLMSGLTAMILLVRRAPMIRASNDSDSDKTDTKANTKAQSLSLHASGLLLYTGVPLLNFLVAYWLWGRYRHQSEHLNIVGRDVLNFQITIYLYILLSLFMVFAFIGIVTTPILIALHFIATLLALIATTAGRNFNYPANIPIIQGRRPKN